MPELLEAGAESRLAWMAIYTLAVGLGMYWVGLGLMVRRLQRRKHPCPSYPPLSVLIPTHRPGEARKLLDQLKKLQYEAPWEAVLIMDRLPEESRNELYAHVARAGIPIQTVEISETAAGWSPKKYALLRGVEVASYEWIVVLDADVQVERAYLSRLMEVVEEGVIAVVGLGWLRGKGVGSLGAWEAALIQLESVGRAAWGCAYMATGRGWAVRKSWLKQGLYLWREVISGDDDLTLQLIPTRYVRGSAAATISDAPRSLGAYLRRKQRHLQTGRYYGIGMLLSLGIVAGGYSALWGVALLTGDFWGAPLLVWLARIFAVFLCGAPVGWSGPLWEGVLVVLQTAVYPLLGLVRVKRW